MSARILPPGPRPAMPANRTVPALLSELAVAHPDVEFVVDGERRLTYADTRDMVERFARGLVSLGVGHGDKVAILMGNRAEWIIADLAILSLGAVAVSLNTWSTRRELRYMLEHSDTRVLVCTDRFLGQDFLGMLQAMRDDMALPQVIRVAPDGRALDGALTWDDVLNAGKSVAREAVNAASARVAPGDVANIVYTSGSTSTPKGVQLQHYGLIENMWWIGERQHLRIGDRLWLSVSLFWSLGCANALFALMTHAGTVVLQESFEPGEAIRLVDAERCTVVYATANMVRAMQHHPDFSRERFSSLRTGVTIGTPEQVRALAELGASEICNVYGQTESYGNCAVTDAGWPLEERATCMGEPLNNVELEVVDLESREPLPAGQVGEMKVRGYVTCGYYKDEEKNREAFDGQGWFLTGDLGCLDAKGRVHFRGRIKEMIKTGGINVAPAEVEQVLMAHPGVEQAYVVGVADAQRDEIVAAVVVPESVDGASESALREHCARELATFKCPRRYLIVDAGALPLTSTGKVRKAGMPALFEVDDLA